MSVLLGLSVIEAGITCSVVSWLYTRNKQTSRILEGVKMTNAVSSLVCYQTALQGMCC
jgi:hypothetical protein